MIELREHIERLGSDDEADRIYAAEDIGFANQAAGIAPLLARLPMEPSRAVREAIFGSLLQIDSDLVIEGVLRLLDSEDSFLRNQAVEILQARGSRAVPYLNEAFRTGDRDRRKLVIDVLARFGDSSVAETYENALRDPDLNVVITAVESIGNTRQNRFRAQIEQLVSPDTHPMLLSACIEALTHIGEQESVDAVRASLGKPGAIPGYLQPSYVKLLGAKGRPEDLDELSSMIGAGGLDTPALNALTFFRSRYPALALPAALASPLENIVAKSVSPIAGYQAVRLLGSLRGERSVMDFLESCLEHPEKSIRIGAVQTMRETHGTAAEAILRRRLAHETDEEVLQVWTGKSGE
jgi:hypothetical protein